MNTVRVAIIGCTGYTALESVRWLLRHPAARITYLASRQQEQPISRQFPELLGRLDLGIRPFDAPAIAAEADVAFVCLPHVSAMEHVPALMAAGLKVVDLSADYRLTDAAIYEKWYGHAHTDPVNLKAAVYGLPEFFAARIREAKLVSNPGCYPTAAALGIVPLVAAGIAESDDIIVNAASGISGAGRKATLAHHFPERNEAFEPYSIGSHRHAPEIEQTVATMIGRPAEILFVPHLLPIDRGILETIYLKAKRDIGEAEALDAVRSFYAGKPFVRVREQELPNTKYVANTNFVDISVKKAANRFIVVVAEDNMVKGAAGQAIQNMNLMFGMPETAGLL